MSDGDRHIRLKGLTNLNKELLGGVLKKGNGEEKQVVLKVLQSQISRFIKGLLEDPVEKIRENTLNLIGQYLQLVEGGG